MRQVTNLFKTGDKDTYFMHDLYSKWPESPSSVISEPRPTSQELQNKSKTPTHCPWGGCYQTAPTMLVFALSLAGISPKEHGRRNRSVSTKNVDVSRLIRIS